MNSPKFTKNDSGFECLYCGEKVSPLGYTSRNHCPKCLVSLHIDVNPGDRKNECMGLLIPIGVSYSNKKGYIIKYKCEKCGQIGYNKSAKDDDFQTLLCVSNGTYNLKESTPKKGNNNQQKNSAFKL